MHKHELIAAPRNQSDAIRAFGATALYLFGPAVRDAASAGSELDLFAEYDPGGRFSRIEMAGTMHLFERHLGIPVDLTTRDSLDPLLREEIEAAAGRIF